MPRGRYAKPYWYIGQADDVGKAQGWLCCKDDAPCPELTKAVWRVSDGQQMIDAPDVRCTHHITHHIPLPVSPTCHARSSLLS